MSSPTYGIPHRRAGTRCAPMLPHAHHAVPSSSTADAGSRSPSIKIHHEQICPLGAVGGDSPYLANTRGSLAIQHENVCLCASPFPLSGSY